MTGEPEYRIEFTIRRRLDGQDDFTDIGFGSSGTWSDLNTCTHMIGSAIEHGEWETEPGMPRPEEVIRR